MRHRTNATRETGPTPEIEVRHADLADHGRHDAAPRWHRIVLPPGSDRRLLGPCSSKQICNWASSIHFNGAGYGKVMLGPHCNVSFATQP